MGWVTRSEFWDMHPVEFHWLLDAKRPPKTYGKLSEDEAEKCYQEVLAGSAILGLGD